MPRLDRRRCANPNLSNSGPKAEFRCGSISFCRRTSTHPGLGVEDVGATLERTAVYHPSCHGTRLLGVGNEPLRLLSKVRGLELRPLANGQDCCGFGGLFCVKIPAVSAAMTSEKAAHVSATGADVLVGTDLGCLMNVAGHMRANGSKIEAMHLAQVLDSGHAQH